MFGAGAGVFLPDGIITCFSGAVLLPQQLAAAAKQGTAAGCACFLAGAGRRGVQWQVCGDTKAGDHQYRWFNDAGGAGSLWQGQG